MVELSLNEFRREYSEEISDFEKETGSHAIWGHRITGNFECWMNQKLNLNICNICNREFDNKMALSAHKRCHNNGDKVVVSLEEIKNTRTILNEFISEFFSEFVKKHKYFTRKHLVDDFVHMDSTPENNLYDLNLEFKSVIKFNIKIGVLEKYSTKTYKRVD